MTCAVAKQWKCWIAEIYIKLYQVYLVVLICKGSLLLRLFNHGKVTQKQPQFAGLVNFYSM